MNAWNPAEAKSDFEVAVITNCSVLIRQCMECVLPFQKAASTDPSLEKVVQQQLLKLEQLKKQKDKQDQAWLTQAFKN